MNKLSSILLVDDDKTTNFLNELMLKKMDVADRLLVALNGREALEMLREHCASGTPTCPVLIFLDINMPVMNGFEFLDSYSQLPWMQHQTTIIVMLTTSLHSRDLHRAEQLPVAGFVSKPLTAEKVEAILRQHFPASAARSSSGGPA
ncbi:CheY-like chemotaxis protein [Hymenobacter luteus]|uniref:CheY-like chemotaxis protein n=2 Tax=Hymenobacter TaxID=89966 RepID=A0A7W9SXS9_9BACT|nr:MULTISPECIES: response regulator [Hymenobacter]MBB4599803.1 CheY-like chemotaxis protein [Hymenobacter latericoloratus]MBB6057887.1 CheY-like chemotaxis protein [Hymenobacter luteus]